MPNNHGSNQYQKRTGSPHPRQRPPRPTRFDHLDHLDPADTSLPDVTRTAAWLRSLPPDTVITWGQDHELIDGHVIPGWVDVDVIDPPSPLKFNWYWTVQSPDDTDEPDDMTIVLEHDADIWGTWDPTKAWWSERHVYPHDTPPPSAPDLLHQGGWTIQAVNDTLTSWAEEHTGRNDLRFNHTPGTLSKITRRALAVKEAIDNGDIEVYDLGDGVKAAAPALDTLLAMNPDEAADVTRNLKAAVNDLSDDPDR